MTFFSSTRMPSRNFPGHPGHSRKAAPYLAVERELGLNREIVNVNGGGIAPGHPIGNTGCRLVATLIHEMEKLGLQKGLAALCGAEASVRLSS